MGLLGDQPHDFKFQYVGAVYRDMTEGINQYAVAGSLWVFIPESDPVSSRVMPPFAGPGNGGWTTAGGPLLRLGGRDIHMFILPTGVRPGAVLEVGDRFSFAGHVAPTLASEVRVTVTSPSGTQQEITGQANKVGYFFAPEGDFTVDEPGVWSVDVRLRHDGTCSGGRTVAPYPSGDVLGSQDGRYWFYVVPKGAQRLDVSTPRPGFLDFSSSMAAVVISGRVPAGLERAAVHYTITMPGVILAQGRVEAREGIYRIHFDPQALKADFPNLDLVGRDDYRPGLADTFSIGLLLEGETADGSKVHRANSLTLQGDQVFVGGEAWIAEPCLGFGEDLGISIPCVDVDGTRVGVTFRHVGGLEWEADPATLTKPTGGGCLPLGADLSLPVECFLLDGTLLQFTFRWEDDLTWAVDPESLVIH